MDEDASPESAAPGKPELALDLNFVPTWARKPPENPYAGREDRAGRDEPEGRRGGMGRRDDRRGSGMGRRDDRPRRGPPREGGMRSAAGSRFPGGAGPRPGGHPMGEGARSAPRGGDDRRRDDRDRRPMREPRPRLDVKVSFLPDRERLALVVRDIQASRRAFPLVEIASRFMGRDDLHLVKLELPPPQEGAERQTFVQCLECKRVFRARANAEAHLLGAHLDKFFAIEEIETEPPAGLFSFVARCGLSGALLGPPNYHGYNEKIQELWATRFAHMSKAEYLGHVETVRDEALVEQWKESQRKKTVYRLKEPPEGTEAGEMDRAGAQEWMRGKLNSMLRESPRCMLPGTQSKKIDDGALRAAVSAAWQKENRFPLTLLLALRPAFRHMRLHLFKVNAKETYVTAVLPTPADLATAPEVVKEIAAYLEAHPGTPRQQVLESLRPGADPESPEAAEVLLHLSNLVANGGVIEFFNGTLTLPRGVAAAKTAASGGDAEPGEAEPGETDGLADEEAAESAVEEEEAAAVATEATEDVGGGVPAEAVAEEPPAPEAAEAAPPVVAEKAE